MEQAEGSKRPARLSYLQAIAASLSVPLTLSVLLTLLIWNRALPPLPGLLPGFLGWCLLAGAVPLLGTRHRSWMVLLGAVLGIPAIGITLAVNFKAVRVEGNSMLPHLQPGDVLLVDLWASPEQFALPGEEVYVLEVEGEKRNPIIKRLIGVPGQTLQVRWGRVRADGIEVHPRLGGEPRTWNTERPVREFGELWDGRKLERDQYFFLGDNPGQSRDSRRFGPVTADQIVGRAVWRLKGPGGFGPIG